MTVNQLSKAERERRLRESFRKGDIARRGADRAGEWFVSSSTHPNLWYRVEANAQTCGCAGFMHRGICRHLVRISWEVYRGDG